MLSEPAVSVLMPVYNTERYVAEAVESILAQTFGDFEFIIIDDGSTDGSRAILERYAKQDNRIRLISRPNTGVARAMNEALGLARGELIAVMDSDDVALPQRFERQVRYLNEHLKCVLVGSRVIIIDPDGDTLREMGEALTHEEIVSAFMMGQGQIVYHPVVMFRRQVVLELGGYRPEYEPSVDSDLFLRLAEVGRIVNLGEPLLKYREHFNKIGTRLVKQQEDAARRVLIDAYRRRGLVPPTGVLERFCRSENPLDIRRNWGWWALMAGHVATARKHAWACLRREPLSPSSWKLLYCALRGY